MRRLLIAALMTASLLFCIDSWDCSGASLPDSRRMIGDAKLYTFSPDDKYFLGDAGPFILPPNTTLKDALNSLGKHLAETYFSKTYTSDLTEISFEVLRIDEIFTPSGPLHVATINMLDSNSNALQYFFQGTTGGQTTFCMLAGTFMQPHLEPPLLDGLVILYNSEILPELDHINLSGILIPRLVRYAVQRAIQSTFRETVKLNRHNTKPAKAKRYSLRSDFE